MLFPHLAIFFHRSSEFEFTSRTIGPRRDDHLNLRFERTGRVGGSRRLGVISTLQSSTFTAPLEFSNDTLEEHWWKDKVYLVAIPIYNH